MSSVSDAERLQYALARGSRRVFRDRPTAVAALQNAEPRPGTETSSPRRRHPPAQYVCLDGDIVLPRIEAAAEEDEDELSPEGEGSATEEDGKEEDKLAPDNGSVNAEAASGACTSSETRRGFRRDPSMLCHRSRPSRHLPARRIHPSVEPHVVGMACSNVVVSFSKSSS